jgi:uncharacterized protein (TIGR03437 family)
VTESTTRTINWTLGTTLPTLLITPISSDAPIAYTVTTTAGTLSPQVNASKGLAYSFGSPLSITFLQAIFGAAAPGDDLVGHVIITPAVGAPIDVTITVRVKSPGAAISSLSPASIPTATTGSFTVVLTGSGFITGVDAVKTKVGVVSGAVMVSNPNIAVNVVNSTTIVLTITVPASADPYLPFTGNGGPVALGVCNPQSGSCSVPTGTATLGIGVNPIIQTITSASSYKQATPPALTPIAAYDLLSIFGTNFCVSGGTGCISPSPATLYSATDGSTFRYPLALTPDAAGATQRNLSVTFHTHAATSTLIATAPLLFATNNQINVIVPDAVKAYIGSTVDVVVNFGFATGATMLKSLPYSLTVVDANPGVFAVGGAGQGDAAALNLGYALISTTNPVGLRTLATDSDIVQLYVTGLGVPDSDGSSSPSAWPSATCMSAANYFAAVNSSSGVTPALTSPDGLVVQSALLTSGMTAPCIKSLSAIAPTVTVGGVTATVLYAGWVPDSVAGLYQINVQVPSSGDSYNDAAGPVTLTSSAVALPIVVTANGKSSQTTGVNLWVIPRLTVTGTGLTGTHNVAWPGSQITATGGTGPYGYVVTTGTLPAGLAIDAVTGAITGTATAAGSTTVVVTATDTITPFLTGTVSITFVID